jgi:hypothetical protein
LVIFKYKEIYDYVKKYILCLNKLEILVIFSESSHKNKETISSEASEEISIDEE